MKPRRHQHDPLNALIDEARRSIKETCDRATRSLEVLAAELQRQPLPETPAPASPDSDVTDRFPPWMDTPTAAAYLSATKRQLESWRSLGSGPPHVKVGRRVRYNRIDLDAWMRLERKY